MQNISEKLDPHAKSMLLASVADPSAELNRTDVSRSGEDQIDSLKQTLDSALGLPKSYAIDYKAVRAAVGSLNQEWANQQRHLSAEANLKPTTVGPNLDTIAVAQHQKTPNSADSAQQNIDNMKLADTSNGSGRDGREPPKRTGGNDPDNDPDSGGNNKEEKQHKVYQADPGFPLAQFVNSTKIPSALAIISFVGAIASAFYSSTLTVGNTAPSIYAAAGVAPMVFLGAGVVATGLAVWKYFSGRQSERKTNQSNPANEGKPSILEERSDRYMRWYQETSTATKIALGVASGAVGAVGLALGASAFAAPTLAVTAKVAGGIFGCAIGVQLPRLSGWGINSLFINKAAVLSATVAAGTAVAIGGPGLVGLNLPALAAFPFFKSACIVGGMFAAGITYKIGVYQLVVRQIDNQIAAPIRNLIEGLKDPMRAWSVIKRVRDEFGKMMGLEHISRRLDALTLAVGTVDYNAEIRHRFQQAVEMDNRGLQLDAIEQARQARDELDRELAPSRKRMQKLLAVRSKLFGNPTTEGSLLKRLNDLAEKDPEASSVLNHMQSLEIAERGFTVPGAIEWMLQLPEYTGNPLHISAISEIGSCISRDAELTRIWAALRKVDAEIDKLQITTSKGLAISVWADKATFAGLLPKELKQALEQRSSIDTDIVFMSSGQLRRFLANAEKEGLSYLKTDPATGKKVPVLILEDIKNFIREKGDTVVRYRHGNDPDSDPETNLTIRQLYERMLLRDDELNGALAKWRGRKIEIEYIFNRLEGEEIGSHGKLPQYQPKITLFGNLLPEALHSVARLFTGNRSSIYSSKLNPFIRGMMDNDLSRRYVALAELADYCYEHGRVFFEESPLTQNSTLQTIQRELSDLRINETQFRIWRGRIETVESLQEQIANRYHPVMTWLQDVFDNTIFCPDRRIAGAYSMGILFAPLAAFGNPAILSAKVGAWFTAGTYLVSKVRVLLANSQFIRNHSVGGNQ